MGNGMVPVCGKQHARKFLCFVQHSGADPKANIQTHKELVKEANEWINSNCHVNSVVAALVATVAFATIPGGFKQDTGAAVAHEYRPAFIISVVSPVIALGFSQISLVFLLTMFTRPPLRSGFEGVAPTRLLLGMAALLFSRPAILLTFCAGHFFVVKTPAPT